LTIKNQKTLIVGIAIAFIFVLVGVFFLSSSMETLDKQAGQLGAEEKPVYTAPFSDYTIPGIDAIWGALIVGIIGTILLFVVSLAVAKLLRKKELKK
jgi:ABC-type phosphate transport system permease subunit